MEVSDYSSYFKFDFILLRETRSKSLELHKIHFILMQYDQNSIKNMKISFENYRRNKIEVKFRSFSSFKWVYPSFSLLKMKSTILLVVVLAIFSVSV